MNALAVIPARGGSKGLPRKNVRPFCGKPLIVWTIEAALRARRVGRVVVSTDDPEIAEVSRAHGAEVVHRPPEISGDAAPSEAALLHAVQELGVSRGPLTFLQCTAPLMLPSDIDGVLDLLTRADTAFTAAPSHRFTWRRGPTGAVPVGHDKSRRPRRQELEAQYVEVGAAYAMTVEGLIAHGHRFYGVTAIYPVAPERSIEIDDEIDFLLAETLMRRRLALEQRFRLPHRLDAVVMDCDGVLTDNRVYVDQEGKESVAFHRGDGWAIGRLKDAGIRLLVLTHENNPVVQRRCEKLGVECMVAAGAKRPYLEEWLDRRGADPRFTVYVGNDLADVECMRYVGCGVAPQDAHAAAKSAATIILQSPGGRGCIRELVDLLFGDQEGA